MKNHALLAAALLLAATAFAADTPKPNFVIINIDDLGYGDIGPFGSTLNRTPNLDRMAKEGRRLTSFYGAPVCSPSRAGKWKLHLARGELYDLATDPGEATNVAAAHPDAVAQLRALGDATDSDLGQTGTGPGVRALGKVESAQPLLGHDGQPRAGFAPK